jgi:hypothetical protein
MLALAGLRQAAEGAESGRGYKHVTAGTGVFWACALDEQLRHSHGEAYEALRNVDGRGRVVHGLRLARNAIAHGAHVVTRDGGVTFPVEFPLVFPPPSWVTLANLLEVWALDARKGLTRQKNGSKNSWPEGSLTNPFGTPSPSSTNSRNGDGTWTRSRCRVAPSSSGAVGAPDRSCSAA